MLKKEKEYKKLYNSFLINKELAIFFPLASGEWENDKNEFIRLSNLLGNDEFTEEEQDEEDF